MTTIWNVGLRTMQGEDIAVRVEAYTPQAAVAEAERIAAEQGYWLQKWVDLYNDYDGRFLNVH